MTVLYLSDFKKWLNEEQTRQQNLNWEEFFTKIEEHFCQINWQNIKIPCVTKMENDKKVLDGEIGRLKIKERITIPFSSFEQHGEVFYKWVAYCWTSLEGSSLFLANNSLVDKLEEDLTAERTKNSEVEQKFQFSESQLKICLNRVEDLEVQLDIQGRDWVKEKEELCNSKKELVEIKKKNELLTQQLEKYLGSEELVAQVLQEVNQEFFCWKNLKK